MKGGWICKLVPLDGQLAERLAPPAGENEPPPRERPPPREPSKCGVGNAEGGGLKSEIRSPKSETKPKSEVLKGAEVRKANWGRQFFGLLAGSALAFGGLNCIRRTSSQPMVP